MRRSLPKSASARTISECLPERDHPGALACSRIRKAAGTSRPSATTVGRTARPFDGDLLSAEGGRALALASCPRRGRGLALLCRRAAGAASSEDGTASETLTLGTDILIGERPQAIVPANWWQSAETLGDWTLVGCTVSPGFEFSTFEMAPPDWKPGRLSYSAAAGCSAVLLRRNISWAASTAPPVTSRQASAMRQVGSAKPNSVRISVDSTGAA